METTQFQNLENKDSYLQAITIPGTAAATSTNYGYVFTARTVGLEIIGVSERHETAGTNGGAVTLDVLKVPSGIAIGSGVSVLTAPFNLKSTADTTVYKQGIDLVLGSVTPDGRKLDPFDSIALKTSGTLTAVAGVCVTIYFKWANNGSYR